MGNMASYSASKAALVHFGAVAAMEAAPHGVRVNTVVPGLVRTPGADRLGADASVYQKLTESIPMGRGGESREIAEAITFLLSDAASYVTGQTLVADGGKTSLLYVGS
jgi:NAD(P)-dependent dehydrogenase (short-subunit alcohol dehydrogenase family)